MVAIVAAVWKLPPMFRQWLDRRSLLDLPDAYSADDARQYTRYYIEPDCQSVDPSGLEDFRSIVLTRTPLFASTDRLLRSPGTTRFLIILADSGMGKTAFLLNYYARHRRRWGWRLPGIELKLVPLNQPDANEMIKAVPEADRKKTILFLDALVEDQQAIANHRKRLVELIELSKRFRAVVITCRSQFFPKDEEIPTATGVITTLPADGSKEYFLQKLYLSPFSDEQVDKYLCRRYGWGRRRTEAREVVKRIPDLVARPLLLTYVEDLTASRGVEHAFQMYEMVVQRWCDRESAFVPPDKLREFSECLAVEMFLARGARQMERIPEAELQPLAEKYGIDLKSGQLRGRSLLNRDAAGHYKFSHRSILEYLFVKRFTKGLVPPHSDPWTDLMTGFLMEMTEMTQGKDGLRYIPIPRQAGQLGLGIYLMTQTPVTVAAYRRFAQETFGKVPDGQKGEDHPVVGVTWQDAVAYCKWAGGRLPSDEEWVHASMAGGYADPFGPLDEVAWYKKNAKRSTHPVGQKKPNAWGLYDMLGNVWEWSEDEYETGNANTKVLRGGSWYSSQEIVRASFRIQIEPGVRSHGVGFRCVRDFP